jgi:hypothetical protein
MAAGCGYDDVSNKFCSARMRRVGHDNDGAAGGKGRRRVTTSHRVRKRKVRRTKYTDWTQGYTHRAEIGTRSGQSVGLSVLDAGTDPFSLFANFGKKS